MSDRLDLVLADLDAESAQLRAAVEGLEETGWSTPTPAPGWSVATQVAHLLWTDETATCAAGALGSDAGKAAWDEIVLAAFEDPTGFVDAAAHEVSRLAPVDLLQRWTTGRAALVEALRATPEGQKLPWFGPPMSPTSMATARFMETWAHALDVYDALGITMAPTDRIEHVAHIGVRTRNYAYSVHELDPPAEEFRIELISPSGQTWTWGPEDASQSVRGPAYDFCLRVTQRVHRDDTALVAVGDDAERWLGIAQCFAGPAGAGREKTDV